MIVMTDAVWRLLCDVNDAVNREPYRTDLELYGKADFWTVMNGNGGDCDDYALTKRQRLIDAGLDARHLLPARGRVASGEGHCVLLVDTESGAYVLDNIQPRVLAWKDPDVSMARWADRATPDGNWVSF